MYPIQNGTPFLVQQSVSGAGIFDGSEYGRAKGVISDTDPNAVVRLSSRLYGTLPNAYTIQLRDMGSGVSVAATTAEQLGSAIIVTLRRSTSALLATAAEVAAAINQAHTGLVATYGGTGNGVVSAYGPTLANNVESGVNPSVAGPNVDQYLWYLPTGTSGGFFFFEQEESLNVRQFEAKFIISSGGPYTVQVLRVNLNTNNEPVASEAVPVFVWDQLTIAKPDIAFSDVGIVLHPQQALQVVTNGGGLPGLARFDVRKGARYPYL